MVTIEVASEEQCENRQGSLAATGNDSASVVESFGCEHITSIGEEEEVKSNYILCDATAIGEEVYHQTNNEVDDWETASEGGDDDDETVPKSGPVNERYEDALTEDEQRQRALSQANTAKSEGNELYAAGKYDEALSCYAGALECAPDHSSSNEIRAMCYSNSALCQLHLNQYEAAVEQSTKALELNPTYVKALLRRAQAQEKLDHLDEALADMKKVLELNPGNQQARETVKRLEPIVEERREKMKEEMIGKMKDLGNSILGRFGMSVDNFKAVKDPNTGSYSISFQR